jgi:PhnB protein
MTQATAPSGHHTVSPYLVVSDANRLMAFLKEVFEGEETERMERDGRLSHGEIRIGDSIVMIGEPSDPSRITHTMLYVYIADPDATFQRGVAAGGTSFEEPTDTPYGDRRAAFRDPFGNEWFVAKRIGQ